MNFHHLRMLCWFHGLLPWHWRIWRLFGCLEAGRHLGAAGGARHPGVTETWRSLLSVTWLFHVENTGRAQENWGRKIIFPFLKGFLRILSMFSDIFFPNLDFGDQRWFSDGYFEVHGESSWNTFFRYTNLPKNPQESLISFFWIGHGGFAQGGGWHSFKFARVSLS